MDVVKKGKKAGSLFKETVIDLLPAIGGGAVGAGIGRNSLYVGIAVIMAAKWRKWPTWASAAGYGMAINGVATAMPVNASPQPVATQEEETGVSGIIPFVQDGFKPRATTYLKNMALKAYLDKVPIVNTQIGLAGVDQNMLSNNARRFSLQNLNPQMQSEINRIVGKMSGGNKSLSGLDAMKLGTTRNRHRAYS